jgi:MoxR-like ATPase
MQERQVTIGGETHHLPKPFLVMATQNPLEQEGTYPLPEAQTDRFLFKILVDYPTEQEERAMMERWGQLSMQPKLSAVSSGEELLKMRNQVDGVHLSPPLQAYMLALVRATRAAAAGNGGKVLSYGASPRASLALVQASRALAWLHGMDHATPEVVQNVFLDALRHRVGLTYEAEAEETTTDEILRGVLERIPVPAGH